MVLVPVTGVAVEIVLITAINKSAVGMLFRQKQTTICVAVATRHTILTYHNVKTMCIVT